MNFVLFGIQGSGKATQAKIIKNNYNLWSYDSGSTLRNIAKGNDDFANLIERKINYGEFVEDSLIMNMVESFISAVEDTQDIILDGLPRNVHQGHLLLDLMRRYRRPFYGIHLKLDKSIAISRILKRWELEQRKDDQKDVIIKRIELFEEETKPVIEYYKSINKLIEVEADQPIDEVAKEIDLKIKKLS